MKYKIFYITDNGLSSVNAFHKDTGKCLSSMKFSSVKEAKETLKEAHLVESGDYVVLPIVEVK